MAPINIIALILMDCFILLFDLLQSSCAILGNIVCVRIMDQKFPLNIYNFLL